MVRFKSMSKRNRPRAHARRRRGRKNVFCPLLEVLETRTVPSSLVVGSNVNIGHMAGSQSETNIAIDPTNPNHMFAAANDNALINQGQPGIFGAYSTDGGATWVSRVVGTGSDLPQARTDPRVAFDQFGNLYLSYLDPTLQNLVVGFSSDGGKTFYREETISVTGGFFDQPDLATGAGSVWVSASVNNGVNTTFGMYAAGAPVTGLGNVGTFITPEFVTGSAGGNVGDIAIGPSGQVMVAYQDPVGGTGSTNIYESVDADGLGAGGFGAPVLVTSSNVNARTIPASAARMITADAKLAWDRSGGLYNGRVYMTYTDAPSTTSNDTNIFLRYSTDSGATWSAPKRVNDDTGTNSQFFAAVAVDQTTGNVGVSWYDARNDNGAGSTGDTDNIANDEVELFASASLTGGISFVPNMQVALTPSNSANAGGNHNNNNDYGDYTGLAFQGGAMYPVWTDNSASLPGNTDAPNLDIATDRITVNTNLYNPTTVAVGEDSGQHPLVKVFDSQGNYRMTILAYSYSFLGGVRVAVGDVNGDGIPDIITAPGPGGGPDIRVFDGRNGALIQEFSAYANTPPQGVTLAAADINRDGYADIITGGQNAAGNPEVKVFSGKDDSLLQDITTYTNFVGGVNVAAGDVNGDGIPEIITAPAYGGGPFVEVFNSSGTLLKTFAAYPTNFTGGTYVATGDISDQGYADIFTGPGQVINQGDPTSVRVFDGKTYALLQSVTPYAAGFGGGIRVASTDVDSDGLADVVTTPGPSGGADTRVYSNATGALTQIQAYLAFDPSQTGGFFAGAGGINHQLLRGNGAFLIATPDSGALPVLKIFDSTGHLYSSFMAYNASMRGGVRVAVGDVNGDGVPDIITVPGPSNVYGPLVRVWDGRTGRMIEQYFAYAAGWQGGVYVASADINRDGHADVITGPGAGGGPDVRVFSGTTEAILQEFNAYAVGWNGGVRVAAGDVNRDGTPDIITGPGSGGGPDTRVFNGAVAGQQIQEFNSYPSSYTGGVYVASADINRDGHSDIITGPGTNQSTQIKAFSGASAGTLLPGYPFSAFGAFQGEARVAAGDVNGDGIPDILVGAGPGGGPELAVFSGASAGQLLLAFYAFDLDLSVGIFTAAGTWSGGGGLGPVQAAAEGPVAVAVMKTAAGAESPVTAVPGSTGGGGVSPSSGTVAPVFQFGADAIVEWARQALAPHSASGGSAPLAADGIVEKTTADAATGFWDWTPETRADVFRTASL